MFESALLLLFATCKFCTGVTSDVKKIVVGSFIRITQWCERCNRKVIWESQPFIGNMPAGNILTSSAILYAGALPTKALRIFRILNCASINTKTFFRHQRQILQPTVSSVWKRTQMSLIQLMKSQNHSLVLSGDGRADSPGHSAKYGSYTLIELSCSKVIDFSLVQVRFTHVYCCIVVDSLSLESARQYRYVHMYLPLYTVTLSMHVTVYM